MAVGLLLRCVLKVTQDAQLCLGPHGKPLLAGDGPCFSISHAGDYAALSVGTCPHGVDMEGISPVELPVVRQCMMPEEFALYRESASPDSFFAQLWTGKESVMKATGLGLHLSPTTFSLLPLGDGEKCVRGQSWFVYQRKFQEYWISLATAEPQEGVTIVQLDKTVLLAPSASETLKA